MDEKIKRGKLIVIEGTDGSGKGTQTKLLVDKLNQDGIKTETMSFPSHGEPCGKLVDLYLNGYFGEPTKIDPKFISSFYAIDRLIKKPTIEQWLNEGKNVVLDRYVESNIGHQGAKEMSRFGRENIFNFINDLEYNQMKLPRPDLVMLLHVPAKISFELIEKKTQRDYIKEKNKDGHEKNFAYLEMAEQSYLHASELYGWKKIECSDDAGILSKEMIQDIVFNEVSRIL
jgi:dTMP kinase